MAVDDLEPKYELLSSGFPVHEPVPYFALVLREPNRIRMINVGPELVRCVMDKFSQLVEVDNSGFVLLKDFELSSTGLFNVYDVVLKRNYFSSNSTSKEEKTLIKVAFCRILGALFCYGYDVIVSSHLARDLKSSSTIFFKLRDPHDFFPVQNYSHKFICISPYSTDNLLLINIPKVAAEPIIKTIHLAWSPGVKSKHILADDDRSVSVVMSLKLNGNPWSQSFGRSGKSSIQARLIILEVARILATYNWRLAININFTGTTDSFFFQWCPHLDFDEVQYCALIMSRCDRLRLLHVPTAVIHVIKESILQFWHKEISKQREYQGTTEFKLGGTPWWSDGTDAIGARFFVASLFSDLKHHGWEVCGTMDLARHSQDKSTFLLKQSTREIIPHMCISFSKTNRIRLIVADNVDQDAELQLTTRMNQTIKQHWVALGPRNYGKSIEWKLEGEPWNTEGIYSDQTRGIFLLCLLLEVIQPLGWKIISSADITSKNLGLEFNNRYLRRSIMRIPREIVKTINLRDANERSYSLMGKPEDMHNWFFMFDESLRKIEDAYGGTGDYGYGNRATVLNEMGSNSVPNLDTADPMMPNYYPNYDQKNGMYSMNSQQPPGFGENSLAHQQNMSRSVPSIAAIGSGGGGMANSNQFNSPSQGLGYNPYHAQSQQQLFSGGSNDIRRRNSFVATGSQLSLQQPNFPRPQSQQQNHPCMANARCTSKRRKSLMRQASAGSLPPESAFHEQYGQEDGNGGFYQQNMDGSGYQMDDNNMEGGEFTAGYKSDGEMGYKSDGGATHFQLQRGNMNGIANRRASRSGILTAGINRRESVDVGKLRKVGSNGYVSDGEGYIISGGNNVNRRISRSGRFGSQGSFLFPDDSLPQPPMHLMRKDTDEDDDEEDDDEEEVQQAMGMNPPLSRTPDSGDELGDNDLILNFNRFQAEAAGIQIESEDGGLDDGKGDENRTGESSCDELEPPPPVLLRRTDSIDASKLNKKKQQPKPTLDARRGSRANSRQGFQSSTSGERSDSQIGATASDGSGRSARMLFKQRRASQANGGYHRNDESLNQDLDRIEVIETRVESDGDLQVPPRRKSVSSQQFMRNRNMSMRGNSKSLNSFVRQESAASFHSGQSIQSTHSAPVHSMIKPRQRQPSIHYPVYQQPQYPQPQQHQRHCQLQQAPCIESCSTQSSSSSASAPPDYDACAGIPPTYDQALDVPSMPQLKMHRGSIQPIHMAQHQMFMMQQQQQQHHFMRRPSLPRQASLHMQQRQPLPMPRTSNFQPRTRSASIANRANELYYMGEFYG